MRACTLASRRAAENHRSLEEEARELLRAGLARQEPPARETLAAVAQRLFGPEHGADLDIPPRFSAPETIPPEFSNPEYE